MCDWESLRTHLASRYRVHRDRGDALSICVDRPRGARLIVVAQRMDSGDEHLELSTPVAEIEQIDARTCLEWNARRVVGALGLADDTVYYKRTFLLRALDVASLDDAISYVAAWGEGIETAIVDSGGQPL